MDQALSKLLCPALRICNPLHGMFSSEAVCSRGLYMNFLLYFIFPGRARPAAWNSPWRSDQTYTVPVWNRKSSPILQLQKYLVVFISHDFQVSLPLVHNSHPLVHYGLPKVHINQPPSSLYQPPSCSYQSLSRFYQPPSS